MSKIQCALPANTNSPMASCTWVYDVQLNITGTDESKSGQQVKKGP